MALAPDVTVELLAHRYNDAPLSTSTDDNWVSKHGGLPPMVRAIARALMRNGHSESGAIQLAIGAVKRWAAGGGNVHPNTRARAAAAVAHWEAMKASTGRSSAVITRAAGSPAAAGSAYAAGHPFFGNQHTAATTAGGKTVPVGGAGSSTKVMPNAAKGGKKGKGGKGGKGKGAKAGAKSTAATAAAAKAASLAAAVTAAQTAVTNAQNATASATLHHTQVTATLAAVQAQAPKDIAFAQSKLTNTAKGVQGTQQLASVKTAAAGRITSAQNAVDNSALALKASQDRLAQAQATLAKAKAAAGMREDGHVITRDDRAMAEWGAGGPPSMDSSGAANLLPVGPSKKQAQDVIDTLKGEHHRFSGSDLSSCTKCGQPVNAAVHRGAPKAEGPGQPIPPVPRQAKLLREGDVIEIRRPKHQDKESATQHAVAAKAQAIAHYDSVEGPLTDSLKALFDRQRKATVGRLGGKRGKQMLKRAAESMDQARAPGDPNEPPIIPPEDTGAQPPVSPSISPGAIFDATFWTDQMAQAVAPHLQTAASLAADAVKGQIRLSPMTDDSTSLGNLRQLVAERAALAAQYATGTTSEALTEALQTGIANGEGIPAIAKRINDVFDTADIVRAKRIAQTETVSAYNAAAHAYAAGLPPDVVGSRRWLAHHDDRTRPTHRLADGQEQPMGAPFYVGGYPMQFPGDKAAPPGEWISCRCAVAYLPPGLSYSGIAKAAQDYVDGLHATPPDPVSPYIVSGVGP